MKTVEAHPQGWRQAGAFPRVGLFHPCSVISISNEVDKMLERAKDVTRQGRYHYIEYARFADDRAPRRRGKEAEMAT